MHNFVRIVSARLGELDPAEAEAQLSKDEEAERARVEASDSVTPVVAGQDSDKPHVAEVPTPPETPSPPTRKFFLLIQEFYFADYTPCSYPVYHPASRPFGLLSIRELLRVVINLLDPTDPAHTDSIRLTSLNIILASLSVCLPHLASFPTSLLPLITDKACKYLFQLVASTEEGSGQVGQSMMILEKSLRIIAMLFGEESMRRNMKLQIELFLSFTLDRLAPPQMSTANGTPNLHLNVGGSKGAAGKHAPNLSISSSSASRAKSPDPSAPRSSMSTAPGESRATEGEAANEDEEDLNAPRPNPRLAVLPARGEVRELLMEYLLHLVIQQPSFGPDMWVNYDCDLNGEDVFDKLVRFLTSVSLL